MPAEASAKAGEGCAPAPSRDRHWWLKMLVASATLAALLLGADFLTPVMRVHYYAWRYRTRRDHDGQSFKKAAEILVARHADKAFVVRMLGEPASSTVHRLDYLCRIPEADDVDTWQHLYFDDQGRATEVLGFRRTEIE